MSGYKLYYLNVRGSAEPSRIIFAQAGVNYEDIRFDNEQWAQEYKESKMTYSSYLNNIATACMYLSEMPFERVPVLEVDGTMIAGSINILRYLGTKFGETTTHGCYLLIT